MGVLSHLIQNSHIIAFIMVFWGSKYLGSIKATPAKQPCALLSRCCVHPSFSTDIKFLILDFSNNFAVFSFLISPRHVLRVKKNFKQHKIKTYHN